MAGSVCVCTPRQRKDLLCECGEGVRGLAPVCDTLTPPEDSPWFVLYEYI
jgi:hypothetical protein